MVLAVAMTLLRMLCCKGWSQSAKVTDFRRESSRRPSCQRTADRSCFPHLCSRAQFVTKAVMFGRVMLSPCLFCHSMDSEVEDLTSPSGAALLTRMLQHGQHLPHDVVVTSVRNLQKNVRDGVKGDKAVLEVTYSATVDLPTHFFLKCNLQRLGAMRLLVATSDVCMCEALFYHYLAPETKDCLRTPKCHVTASPSLHRRLSSRCLRRPSCQTR